ncbi:YsnF/AvaK domain-containing protein [Siphonobacter sp.]|uniref:YsnF/AvaK domain-containing protein n=1 Tax=Siphonobacter sp. TaxID=1869184 RepID=UPI003B3B8291
MNTNTDPSVMNESGPRPVVLLVIQERVNVDTETQETGRVTVTKRVHEHEERVELPLTQQQVKVERVAINQYIDTPPAVRYEGETMIVPVVKEILVKRLVLVEEVRITKEEVQTTTHQPVMLRQEEIVITRSTGPEA